MPDWKKIVVARLAELNLSPSAECDLAEELAQHLEDTYRDALSGGAPPGVAYRAAIAELDDTHPIRRQEKQMPKFDSVPPGDSRRSNLAEDLWRDLRYSSRTMRKSPVFVLFVVITLALGIGANTTVFTVINTLILNPVPVRDASTLAAVVGTDAKATSKSAGTYPISYADLKDYENSNQVFASFAGYTNPRLFTVLEHGTSRRIFAELVTDNYFSTLGLTPAIGRFFSSDAASNSQAVAVLNYGTWQARFGGAGDILGRTILLNNVAFTVIGVAPPNFIGMNSIFGPDIWVPATMVEQLVPGELAHALTDRGQRLFTAIGRLKPGISRVEAQSNIVTIASGLARNYPEADEGHTAEVVPVRDVLFGSSSAGANAIMFASAGLLAVVAIVLLIGCSNVANLLLARSASRQQEMAVRLAMGANRRRLMRQMLTESIFLGVLSGLVGLMIGYAGLRVLFSNLPASANFPVPKLDFDVFAFAAVVSIATGVLFGMVPAWKASRADVAETLKQEARTSGRSRRRVTIANGLLVGQVAFSFLLLAMAALFLRSIQRAYRADPGFQTAHLAIFMTNPGQAGYKPAETKNFYTEVRDRVSRIPEVDSVSWSSNLPLWSSPVNGIEIEGRQQRSRTDKVRSVVTTIDVNYFQAAGVRLLRGREFTTHDDADSTPVAIVNEKIASDFWPGGAIGKRIQIPGERMLRQVVGVARTANYTAWGEAPQAAVYIPLAQKFSDAMTLYVRSHGRPEALMKAVDLAIRAAGPQILIDQRTGAELVNGGLFQPRMGVGMLAVFGLLALVLASIGLYGILAYSVNQRKREIGVRMALGASQSSVLTLVLREGMSLVGAGVGIGLIGAMITGRLLAGMLYGITGTDPLSIAAAAVVLAVVAFVACYLPARWATRIDPMAALHES